MIEGAPFSLSFTSPGDDLNTGNLTKFIIFYSINRTELHDLTPDMAVGNITQDMLSLNVSMESIPPFTKVNLMIERSFFDRHLKYYFRVLAIDLGGKTSESNFAVFAPISFVQLFEVPEKRNHFWQIEYYFSL